MHADATLASCCGVNAASGGGLENCSSFAAPACTALQAHWQVQSSRVLKASSQMPLPLDLLTPPDILAYRSR